MKKSNNLSYNRIIEYINNNSDLEKNKKRFLISYATQLNEYDIENKETENVKDLLQDIKYLNFYLKIQKTTPISLERFEKLLNIFERLLNISNLDDYDIKEISYELDKLHMDMDLKVRKNSSLSYNFDKHKRI